MIISLSQYTYEYKSGVKALDVSSLNIALGETLALVGRNGSGKSTLLHCLAGVFNTRTGTRHCRVAAEKISLVFQTPCLDKKLTVRENLVLFGKVWGLSARTLAKNLEILTSLLDLSELLDCIVGSLSGGQQRRADLARALLSEPQVLFLDEPTSGLDIVAQREFWSVLAKARAAQPNLTLICASHHSTELGLFDRIIFLEQGRIELDLPRFQLLKQLPPETLEIHTTNGSNLSQIIEKKLSLRPTELMHDKLVLHSHDATKSLAELKSDNEIDALIESTTVRKTLLADAVWQKLLELPSRARGVSSELGTLSGIIP